MLWSPPVAVMGFAVLSPILRSGARHACKEPAIAGSGSARTGPPQALNIAIADRGDAVCREPFVDRAAAKQRVFAGAPAGMLRRNRLDLARRCRMQGEMRDPGLEALDRLAIARLDHIGLDRQCAAEMVDDRQPGRIEPRHRRGIALAFWRPADHPRPYRLEPILKGEPHMQIDQ